MGKAGTSTSEYQTRPDARTAAAGAPASSPGLARRYPIFQVSPDIKSLLMSPGPRSETAFCS